MLGRRFTSSRIRKERQKRMVLQALLGIVLIAALFFLIVEIVHLKQLRIEHVRFEGNVAVKNQELWSVLQPHVEGDYARLFSKKNIFIVPTTAIEQELKERIIRLEDVHIYREGMHTLVVETTERQPAGIWCGAADNAACVYIDKGALAFADAPKLSGLALITYEKPFPGTTAIGRNLTEAATFDALHSFVAALIPLGFQTERVTWTDDSLDLSERVVLQNLGAAHVIMKIPLAPPYDTALSNLRSVLQPNDEGPALSLAGIHYVDLRSPNKVFYKKGGVEGGSTTQATTTSAQ